MIIIFPLLLAIEREALFVLRRFLVQPLESPLPPLSLALHMQIAVTLFLAEIAVVVPVFLFNCHVAVTLLDTPEITVVR
jgi:hypothetical protein